MYKARRFSTSGTSVIAAPMKAVFASKKTGTAPVGGDVDDNASMRPVHAKDTFQFNFNLPGGDASAPKKKRNKKKRKKKTPHAAGEESGAIAANDSENDSEDGSVQDACPVAALSTEREIVVPIEVAAAPQVMPTDIRPSMKKSNSKKIDKSDPVKSCRESNGTSGKAQTPVATKPSKAANSKKSTAETKKASLVEDDDFDAILKQFSSMSHGHSSGGISSPPGLVKGEGPRFMSPNDPELDSKSKLFAKYGQGKSLVAIGPKKVKDPHWLGRDDGLEYVNEVAADSAEIVLDESGMRFHHSPFSFSFGGI